MKFAFGQPQLGVVSLPAPPMGGLGLSDSRSSRIGNLEPPRSQLALHLSYHRAYGTGSDEGLGAVGTMLHGWKERQLSCGGGHGSRCPVCREELVPSIDRMLLSSVYTVCNATPHLCACATSRTSSRVAASPPYFLGPRSPCPNLKVRERDARERRLFCCSRSRCRMTYVVRPARRPAEACRSARSVYVPTAGYLLPRRIRNGLMGGVFFASALPSL